MEFFRVTSVNDEKFNTAMELYKVSFPKHEQREEKSQKKILSNNEYHTKNSGHKLTVMSYPNPLKYTEYNNFKEYLDNTVMAY